MNELDHIKQLAIWAKKSGINKDEVVLPVTVSISPKKFLEAAIGQSKEGASVLDSEVINEPTILHGGYLMRFTKHRLQNELVQCEVGGLKYNKT